MHNAIGITETCQHYFHFAVNLFVLFWVQVNPDASFVKMETCSAKAVCEACDVLVVATSLPVDLHI